MIYSRSDIFCDFLGVTCSPDVSFADSVRDFMVLADCPVQYAADGLSVYRVGLGTLKLECKSKWHYVGVTGSALAHLRSVGLFDELLFAVGSLPHTVTRLDAAADIGCDFPEFLRALDSEYPDRRVALTRKRQAVSVMLEPRASDGVLTGSYYVGKRGNTVTLAVYDKQQEALVKRGGHLPPCTRVELRVSREVGATLRDAAMPASLFHHYVPGRIVPAPADVAAWESHASPWVPDRPPEPLDFAVMKRRIENSPELDCLVALARRLGPEGRTLLLAAISRAYDRSDESPLVGASAAR